MKLKQQIGVQKVSQYLLQQEMYFLNKNLTELEQQQPGEKRIKTIRTIVYNWRFIIV